MVSGSLYLPLSSTTWCGLKENNFDEIQDIDFLKIINMFKDFTDFK